MEYYEMALAHNTNLKYFLGGRMFEDANCRED